MLPLPCKVPDHMLELTPQYRGRVIAAWPSVNLDISGFGRHLAHNAVQQTAGPQGGRANIYNGTSSYSHCRPVNTESKTGTGTIIVRYCPLSTTTGRAMIGQNRGGVAQYGLRSNTVQHYGRTIAAGAYTGTTVDGWKTVVASIGRFTSPFVGQRAMESYEKGKRVGGGDGIDQPAGGYLAATANFSVCGVTTNNSTWSTFYNAIIDMIVILDYKMPEAEMAQISLNPLRLFQLRMPYWIRATASGTNYSNSVAESSIWAEGQTPSSQLINASVDGSIWAEVRTPTSQLQNTSTDGSVTSDSGTAGLLLTNSVTDGSTASDTSAHVCNANATVSDVTTVSDTLTTMLTSSVSVSDGGVWSESKSSGLSVVVVDGGVCVDASSNVGGYYGSASESASSSDAVTPVAARNISASDGTVHSEYGNAGFSLTISCDESSSWSDSDTHSVAAHVAVVDSALSSDSESSRAAITASLSDGTIWYDSGDVRRTFFVTTSDGSTSSESRSYAYAASVRVVSSSKLSDTPSSTAAYSVQMSDVSVLAETEVLGFEFAISDGFVASDGPKLGFAVTASETSVHSETAATRYNASLVIVDGTVWFHSGTPDNGLLIKAECPILIGSPFVPITIVEQPVDIDVNNEKVSILVMPSVQAEILMHPAVEVALDVTTTASVLVATQVVAVEE